MLLAVAACVLAGWPVGGAEAAGTPHARGGPPTQLQAAFQPKRLGGATTIAFTIAIDPPASEQPPPLSSVDVSYPSDLGFATSGLGLAACDPVRLETEGGAACPANSKVGSGDATVAVSFGPSVVDEHVTLGLYAGPSPDGYLHLLILASGREPVEARIVMTGVVLPGHLKLSVPAVPGLPGGEDIAIRRIHATLGGALTYYERVHGRVVAYRPRGVALPDRCPHGGWRLAARLGFLDGQSSSASDAVGCPRR